MRRPILLLLVAGVLTGLTVLAVVVLTPAEQQAPEDETDAPFATTPLADVDTLVLTVPRAAFCDRVDPREVEAALDSAPDDASTYANGDEVELADGLTDVAHEYGCVWSTDDGSEARAWVFAPPVDRKRAEELARGAARSDGCTPVDGPPYGDPTVALLCTDGPLTSASYRGLFGDAWLACELLEPTPADGTDDLVARTGAWCAAVARGASDAG